MKVPACLPRLLLVAATVAILGWAGLAGQE